ncbi:MAG: serine/threonine-protein phosphatase [Fimbriimonadaceae bacterium]|nr:serine/threonine-protein phosphatase [Fimbriimonadaceae bacterium]
MEEITAEFAPDQLVAPVVLHHRPVVTVGAKSDMGRVRENNEDKHEFFVPETEQEVAAKGLVFVVCDGMGGHEAGQIASEMATKTFIDVYRNHTAETEAALRGAVAAANRFVHDVGRSVPSRRGMGSTLSALVLLQDQGYIAQVGDSRVYRLRDGETQQLTVDHTWVEETVRAGMMDRASAEASPYRHMITRAIGPEPDVIPDIFQMTLVRGDVFMLCSDGVTNHVGDAEIHQLLADHGPSEAAWRLVGAALVGGGSDNATVVVVRVDDVVEVS